MNRKILLLLLAIGLLAFGIGLAVYFLASDSTPQMTFDECQAADGEAWLVDLYHPDICPACAEYRACEESNPDASDIRQACPQIDACTACMDDNFPYPNACPGGKEKIGEISDAAIWFQCCK